MDKFSHEQRSKCMAAIRSKDTKPELTVRRGLWSRGFRYRLNHSRLPGHPDLVLRKYRTCIFVNGCFWHGHHVHLPSGDSPFAVENSKCCKIPATNRDFWMAKIRRNQERDRQEKRQLAAMGWHCITVWECELTPQRREETLASIAFTLNHIYLQDHAAPTERPAAEPLPSMPMAAENQNTSNPN
ncbi:MAG: DNA mismatch endonuclease Vsr [Prevotella sp.]|nr:DNA mismatch endonuclease Vsr [Prevotella sp.]